MSRPALLLRRLAIAWLLLALGGAQTLGLLHQVVHGASMVQEQGQAVTHAALADAGHPAAHSGASSGEPASALARLFSGHAVGKDCRLYDQLSHSDLLCAVPAVVLPVLPPLFTLRFFQGEFLARHAALFHARGPPAFR